MPQQIPNLLFLVQVSRPIVWPILPLVYGLGLHASHATVGFVEILQMLLLTFPMNLIGCGLNDIYDYESDRRSPRRRAVWGAVVRHEDRPLVLRAVLITIPFVLLGACLARNSFNFLATASLVLVAWLYSVPPVRLKERPPLDSLANGIGYFLLPFAMGYSLCANPFAMPLRYYLIALCVCGVHALASAADYDADRAAGHRTLAVAFGRRAAAGVACAAFLAALVIGDYQSAAVRIYIAAGTIATCAATLFPRDIVVSMACVAIFIGFVVAAIWHVAGW